MEQLHSKRDYVLALDSNAFIVDHPEALETFLTLSTATHIQNWIFIWQPLIVSSVKLAKDLSICGVWTLSTHFTPDQPPNRTPRRPNSCALHNSTPPPKPTPGTSPATVHSLVSILDPLPRFLGTWALSNEVRETSSCKGFASAGGSAPTYSWLE
jgi:hypothetical protein